jgi:hypothetical protein
MHTELKNPPTLIPGRMTRRVQTSREDGHSGTLPCLAAGLITMRRQERSTDWVERILFYSSGHFFLAMPRIDAGKPPGYAWRWH